MPIMTRYTHSRAVVANNWHGKWSQREYKKDDIVVDGSWLMIANKDTEDRAAPQKIGPEIVTYNGTSPTTLNTVKKITSGIDIVAGTSGFWLNGYELYVVAGNHYRVYSVNQENEVSEQLDFVADTTGWIRVNMTSLPVPPGEAFALLQVVAEPDPTPTVWVGNWDYDTPNNDTPPISGQATHSDRLPDTLRVHKTDNDGTDRGAELLALAAGDIIDAVGMSWAIQKVTDSGTHVSFSIAPSQQGSPDGIAQFSFETVTATPITIVEDTGYWLTNQPSGGASIMGLFAIDGDPIAQNDNAYGVNPVIQEAFVSEDWDGMALSGNGGGGSTTSASTIAAIPVEGYTGNVRVGQGHNRKTFHIENGLVKDVT